MRWRYRAQNLPLRGVGAFAPVQSTDPVASSWGLVQVAGAPGNLSIPSPSPGALPNVSVDPRTSNSHAGSPDVIRPAVYVTTPAFMHGPVPNRPVNTLPVPAINYTRVPRTALRPPPRLGGRAVIPWPRAFQRWDSEVPGLPAS